MWRLVGGEAAGQGGRVRVTDMVGGDDIDEFRGRVRSASTRAAYEPAARRNVCVALLIRSMSVIPVRGTGRDRRCRQVRSGSVRKALPGRWGVGSGCAGIELVGAFVFGV